MNRKKQFIIVIITIIIMVLLDQIVKLYMINQNEKRVVIEGILQLNYNENTGIAFGMAKNNLLGVITTDILVIVIISQFLIKQIENMKVMTKFSLILILIGGISNLIDRIVRKKVIDYIDISLIVPNFPIFNLADIFIVIGFIIFVISVGIDLIKLRQKN